MTVITDYSGCQFVFLAVCYQFRVVGRGKREGYFRWMGGGVNDERSGEKVTINIIRQL